MGVVAVGTAVAFIGSVTREPVGAVVGTVPVKPRRFLVAGCLSFETYP